MAIRMDDGAGGAAPDPSRAGKLVRAALDALGFGFAIFDGNLRLVAANPAFRELRGYPESLCRPGTHIGELYQFNALRGDYGEGDHDAMIRVRLRRAESRERETLEYELANGRVLIIDYIPVEPAGLLVTYSDVTERTRMQRALSESEERYSLAMAGANEGMWDWHAGTDQIVISESYKRLIGLDAPGDRITLADWMALIHPDDLATRDEARRAHLHGGAEFYDCEYRVRCGDDGYRWFRDRAQSLRAADGKIVRMTGSISDVTLRKQAQDDLVAANRRIQAQNRLLSSLSEQLAKYLSPQVYSSIFKGTQPVEISAERKKLTVFFADIANFTQIAEGMESEELTGLLNHYLTVMSDIALDHGATIDKYMGDAILGFFGDPETRGARADALACVEMARAMQARMGDLQRIWHDQGIEQPVAMRIGINTGYCTVGNFGSDTRMDYTIIGNEANLASRLQTHAQPGEILVAHETYSLVKDTIAVEELAPVVIKGFSRPIRPYRVIGRLDELRAEGRIIREYHDGVRIFIDLFRADREKMVRTIEGLLAELRSR